MTRELDQRINDLAHEVLAAAMQVSNVLGCGFLEKVYERALVKELFGRGIKAEPQAAIQVLYKGESVGDFFADVLVENCLIVELKCVERLSSEHLAQCINYLKATGHPLALLINFQHPRLEWKRVVLTVDKST
jgi:GxxExxY protein